MDRNSNLFLARVCEQAERFEDMLVYVKNLAQIGTELTLEERNLFSVAYKNVVGSRRTAWRAVQSIMQREVGEDKAEYREIVQGSGGGE